jgi:predicted phage terminase large subunit-like protein
MKDQDLVYRILRNDFESFLHRCFLMLNPGAQYLPNWHVKAISHQLQHIRDGEINRLIINMPPRYLKSLTVSVILPAFLLGHNPRMKIFGVSYSNDLSAKHAADFRAIVQSDWYQKTFPSMRVARIADSDIFTTKRGFRRSTSVSATLTGLGGDMIILDDPQKPVDAQSDTLRNSLNQWFTNTLLSRLDNKATGVIILVMQRVHLHDLTGFLVDNSKDWTVLSLPAIAEVDEKVAIGEGEYHTRRAGEALHPTYETLSTLEKLRNEMGSAIFSAQYQQSPVPDGGAMIKRAWLHYYDQLPERSYRTKVIQSWDTAAKVGAQNDWSVCTTWLLVDNRFYLMDLVRGRYEYPQLRAMAIAQAQRYDPLKILIEDTSTGIALAQELRQSNIYAVKPVPVERDKLGRLFVHQAKFEAGLVLFPRKAPFLAQLETELLNFPQGKHDDQVDSLSQALAYKGGYDTTLSWVG